MDKSIAEMYDALGVKQNETIKVGRYTIVHLVDIDGREAVGISRCSDSDQFNSGLGLVKAQGRAIKALTYKIGKRKIRGTFLG